MREHTLRGLKTFCTAARHLSFKGAAEELCITPSAVSHQIKALESLFGAALFERLTREIALTEDGAALYARIDPLLKEVERVADEFLERAGSRRVLRITLLPFFASEMFIPRLTSFTERHAKIEIRVETTEAGAAHSAGSDASILLLPSQPQGLCAYPLFSLRLVPAAAPALLRGLDMEDPRAIARQKLIVHKSRPGAWKKWLQEAALGPDVEPEVIYLDSMFAVARAAEQGLGVALVPVPLSNRWFESGSLLKASRRELQTPDRYYFVHRTGDASNRDVCALRAWVIETFSKAEEMSAVA